MLWYGGIGLHSGPNKTAFDSSALPVVIMQLVLLDVPYGPQKTEILDKFLINIDISPGSFELLGIPNY